MINQLLSAIRNELNDFIKVKDPINFGSDDIVVLSNLVEQNGELAFVSNSGGEGGATEDYVVITLVNIEEERILKEQIHYQKTNEDNILNRNPEIKVNLSVLFTAYSKTSYGTALRLLSYLLSFFQMKNVFTQQNTPELSGIIEKATVELQTLSAEQNNHLWGYLGAKYIPSVVYRIRMLVIQEGQKTMEAPPITIIDEQFSEKGT
jgi:hypothetical protein